MMTIADRHSNKKLPPIEGVVTPATTAEGPRANKPLSRLEEVSGSESGLKKGLEEKILLGLED